MLDLFQIREYLLQEIKRRPHISYSELCSAMPATENKYIAYALNALIKRGDVRHIKTKGYVVCQSP